MDFLPRWVSLQSERGDLTRVLQAPKFKRRLNARTAESFPQRSTAPM